jgi:hypothetical protein
MEQLRVFHDVATRSKRPDTARKHRHAYCRKGSIRTGCFQASSLPQSDHDKTEETMTRPSTRAADAA